MSTLGCVWLKHFSWINEGTPCITDCVMAELEKLGQKYRVALRYILHACLIKALNDLIVWWPLIFCVFVTFGR